MTNELFIRHQIIINYLDASMPAIGIQLLNTIVDDESIISIITKMEILGFNFISTLEQATMETFINSSTILDLNNDIVNTTIAVRKIKRMKLPDAIGGLLRQSLLLFCEFFYNLIYFHPMKKFDILWKGIIEDMPIYFLLFFFPQARKELDLEKGVEFLDKELEELFPMDNPNHPRFVDKLLKVFTLEGREEWILIHIEVQGYQDENFARRMYTYFYRLLDRYQKPVTALAIFTDDTPGYKPNSYHSEFMGTSQSYKFNTYKILEQDEETLAAHANPFALVVLTVLAAIKNKKTNDENLLKLKIDLFRRMHESNLDGTTMRALANFLKMYVRFSKPESYRIFETEIQTITSNKSTMGIEELILEHTKAEERAELSEKFVRNLIIKLGLSDEQVANVAGVTLEFVQQVRASLQG